jgi:hypothetical protein
VAQTRLFLLPQATRHDAAIDAWLHAQVPDLGVIAHEWFSVLRACGDDVCETMHDGAPTACAGDAAFAYVAVHKAHVNLGFFYGALLSDPARVLQGTGLRMRHVKLTPGAAPDIAALRALIDDAYADVRGRVAGVQRTETR